MPSVSEVTDADVVANAGKALRRSFDRVVEGGHPQGERLDVAVDEDSCRVRKDNAPESMAMPRHIALNLLKAGTTKRASLWESRAEQG